MPINPSWFSREAWRLPHLTSALIAACLAKRSYPVEALYDGRYSTLLGGVVNRHLRSQPGFDVEFTTIDVGEIRIVSIQGTDDQWKYLLSRVLSTSRPWLPAGVYVYGAFAAICDDFVQRFTSLGLSNKATVLVGHSLGGAIATLGGFALKQIGVDVLSIFTFGCPRTTNARFRSHWGEHVFNFVNTRDPVTYIPFSDRVYVEPTIFGLSIRPSQYVMVGQELGFEDETSRLAVRSLAEFPFRWITVQKELIGAAHNIDTYLRRIALGLSAAQRRELSELIDFEDFERRPVASKGSLPPSLESMYVNLRTAAIRQERDFLRPLIGANSPLRLRLFTGPRSFEDGEEPTRPIEAAFAGYEPLRLPPEMRISDSSPFESTTGHVPFEFVLREKLAEPVTIEGVYLTGPGTEGTDSVIGLRRFVRPRIVQARGERIRGAISLSAVKA